MRVRETISRVDNVGAGKKAVISPAVGKTWLEQHIDHSGVTLAQMKNIKVILVHPVKEVVLQSFADGVELDEMNKRYGRKTAAGTLSIYYRRPELDSEIQRMSTALGTMGLQSLRIEMDIDGAAAAPVLSAWGKYTANRSVNAGFLTFIRGSNKGGNSEGENHNDDIVKRDRIAAIHVLNNAVDEVSLTVDGSSAFNWNRTRNEFDEESNGRVPYADDHGFCLDFLLAGTLDETLEMQDYNDSGKIIAQVQEMRLSATLGAGADPTVRYVLEYLTNFNSLAYGGVKAPA